MKNIRIEEVGDINSNYPYLEVFFKQSSEPFLEVSISDDKHLQFKFYQMVEEIQVEIEELEYIIAVSKDFLPKALKNEEDFLKFGH